MHTIEQTLYSRVSPPPLIPDKSRPFPIYAGFFFGLQQSIAPTMVSELFGLAHFATNTAMLSTMFVASSFGLASALPSWVIRRAEGAPGSHGAPCRGAACFRLTFLVVAAAACVATALALLLAARKAKFYARISRCVLWLQGLWSGLAMQGVTADQPLRTFTTCLLAVSFAVSLCVCVCVPLWRPLADAAAWLPPRRRIERERGKRGTAAVHRERERAVIALDRRLGAASTAVLHAQLASGRVAAAADALDEALGRRPPPRAATAARGVAGALSALDGALGRAAGVLEGDEDDELFTESLADSESFISVASPTRRSLMAPGPS
jgi:hypothetical protein